MVVKGRPAVVSRPECPHTRGPARQPGDRNRPKLLGRLSNSKEIRIHPPIETTRQGLRRRGRRARTDNPQLSIRTGGQARVLGEEKEEGTSGFVELDTADPQERVNAPVKSCGLRTSEITISHTSPFSWHHTRRSTAKGRVPRAGQLRTATVPSGERSQRVAADRP